MTIHRLVPSQRHGFVALLILVSIIRSTSFLQPRPSTFRAVSLFRTLLIGPNDYGRCRSTKLYLSNPNFDEKQQPRNINSLSASQKERREEDVRRKARLQEGFATPGLTSALPGARDFAINIAQTEREYLQSLGSSDDDSVIDERNVDKYVAIWTEEGLAHLRMLRFQEASQLFNEVYQIKPDAYIWQDGLVKYYLGDYHAAAESLADNALRYESRFMEPASEERIWRDAAELKIVHNFNGGRVSINNTDFPVTARVLVEEGVDAEQSEKESIFNERRKVIRLARQLFSNSLRNNEAGVALARAQLQAICGDSFPSALKSILPLVPNNSEERLSSSTQITGQQDRKMYKLHSLFYLGLHFDALGQSYESKQCMKMAIKTFAYKVSGNSQDITYLLPVIHMTVRDWYDDDDDFYIDDDRTSSSLVSDEKNECKNDVKTATGHRDSEQVERLRKSIQGMRMVELKNELKKCNLKVSGSKKELQDRLFDAFLIDDVDTT